MYKTKARSKQHESPGDIGRDGKRIIRQPIRHKSECSKQLDSSAEYNKIAWWVSYLTDMQNAGNEPMVTPAEKLKLQRLKILNKDGEFDQTNAEQVLAEQRPRNLGDPVIYKEKTFRKELPLVTP